jgi:ribosomal-protein-alanine N-acetyltransferase
MDDLLTKRLNISPLDSVHSAFIFELVNSPGWKEFIGERNVNSIQDAEIYIINILANDNIKYHVISIKSKDIPIGIVTFIKRDYLDHHDIGFAFLPQYSGMDMPLKPASIY